MAGKSIGEYIGKAILGYIVMFGLMIAIGAILFFGMALLTNGFKNTNVNANHKCVDSSCDFGYPEYNYD